MHSVCTPLCACCRPRLVCHVMLLAWGVYGRKWRSASGGVYERVAEVGQWDAAYGAIYDLLHGHDEKVPNKSALFNDEIWLGI